MSNHDIFSAEIEANRLKTITKEEVQQFYKDYIHVNGQKRAKLVVHVLAKDMKECEATNGPSVFMFFPRYLSRSMNE